MPQLFRYERQQKGRLREHFQLNVDLFGAADVAADAELVACAVDIMRAFGLGSQDVVVRVSDRRILQAYLESLGVPADAVPGVYGVIDKLERQPAAVSAEKLASLGVPGDAIDRIVTIADVGFDEISSRLAGTAAAPVVQEFGDFLRFVPALLGGDESWLRLDLSIVRGLAYYTGIVFELFDRSGEFRAICGGGRYDTLLQSLGGTDLPALGFGMGDVVLGELLRAKGLMRPADTRADYWISGADDVSLEKIMREAARLRAEGQAVEYALRAQSLSKQKKAAQASGAKTFVTLTTDGTNG
jgi:histidyl-tRNA synthetase